MSFSGILGGKVPVVDDVLSSHEQEVCPINSFDENGIEFEFQQWAHSQNKGVLHVEGYDYEEFPDEIM